MPAQPKLPRVMIMQPSFTEGRPLDLRILGVQFWISNQLAGAGFQAASVLVADPAVTHEKRLAAVRPPSDSEATDAMKSAGCQFAMHSFFDVEPSLRLSRARVLSAKGQQANLNFNGRNDALAPTTLSLFTELLRVIGFKVETPQWHELFGTRDLNTANHFLMVLGAHAMADQGFRVDDPRRVMELSRKLIVAGMDPATQVFPHLIRSLRASKSIDDDALREEVRATLRVVSRTPGDWMATLSELGVSPNKPN